MISSYNEWDSLKRVIVGTATNANWPLHDPVFKLESTKTTWKETPVPSGPVPQHIIDESNEDLDLFVLAIDDINKKISDSLLALLIEIHNSYENKNWIII